MGLGLGEILLILFVVLLIFGAGRLPTLGDSLGKALKNFKKAATTNEIDVTPPQERLETTKAQDNLSADNKSHSHKKS